MNEIDKQLQEMGLFIKKAHKKEEYLTAESDTDTAKKKLVQEFKESVDKTEELLERINPKLAKDAKDAAKNKIRNHG